MSPRKKIETPGPVLRMPSHGGFAEGPSRRTATIRGWESVTSDLERTERGARGACDQAADAAMDRYAAGDASAFAELYDLLAPRLYAFLVKSTRDRGEAEDLLQQTLMRMHAARGRFIRGAHVVPWAFAIAARLAIDHARRRRARPPLSVDAEPATTIDRMASPDVPADDAIDGQALASVVRDALARLPEDHRRAFELVKQEGLTNAEAARRLGTTVMAVKLRAHRGLVALRRAVRKALEPISRREESAPWSSAHEQISAKTADAVGAPDRVARR